jgi:hypothetical protein
MNHGMSRPFSVSRRAFLGVAASASAGWALTAADSLRSARGAGPLDPKPSKYRADWMQQGSFGIMVHWLAPGPLPEKGKRIEDLNQAVDAFDLDRFLRDFDRTGADWLIFTIGQNTSYYASPNAVLDRLAGPGHCSKRDLVFEIARRIDKRGKRFIAYLPSEVNEPKPLHTAFAWNPKKDQSEFQRRYTEFVREYSVRYGKSLDGWWFDGCYTWDVFPNHTYNWPLWFKAARAGNPDAIVAFNDGSFCSGIEKPVTPLQDYLSGEVEELIDGKIRLGQGENAPRYLPKARFVEGTTCQWHALVPIDCPWAYYKPGPMPPPKYSDEELFRFVKSCRVAGGAVTLNIGIYQEGHLAKESVSQLSRMALALRNP